MFDINEEDKQIVIDLCRDQYKNRRYKMKTKYFNKKENLKRPHSVLEDQWKWLLEYWSSDEFKKMSEGNAKNRSKVDMGHTSGTKIYMRIRTDEQKNKGNEPSDREFFVMTHKKNDGSWVDSSSESLMARYEEEVASKLSEDGSTSVNEEELFSQVFRAM